MDRALKAMCTDSIIVHKFVSRDGAGDITYDSAHPITLACFVSRKRKLIRTAQGKEVISEATIIIDADATSLAITVEDKIILPDGSFPAILRVFPCRGEKTVEHVEVNT